MPVQDVSQLSAWAWESETWVPVPTLPHLLPSGSSVSLCLSFLICEPEIMISTSQA